MPTFLERFQKESDESLEATWWLMDYEPGFDDVATKAGRSLDQMATDLGIYPFQDRGGDTKLFIARFEFPKFGEGFFYGEAVFAEGNVIAFIDFLGGFPIDCCEMLLAIGEISSTAGTVYTSPGTSIVAHVPSHFFRWPEEDKILMNLTALPIHNLTKIFAHGLESEPSPHHLHWWLRLNYIMDEEVPKRFPVPGEFLALGVRMMPDKPWGHQLSSPFLYSGSWMDTIYYTAGVVKEIIEATEEIPYNTYKVQWRVNIPQSDNEGVIDAVNPTDFATYQVGERVCILKDVETTKKRQLWKDADMITWGDMWTIAPISFYNLGYPTP